MTDTKWPSKNGYAIVSDVTDKLPPKGVQVTKSPENVTCGDVSNVGGSNALGDLRLLAQEMCMTRHVKFSDRLLRIIDELKRALSLQQVEATDQGLLERCAMRLAYENDKLRSAQQQPVNQELLDALKALLAGLEKTTWSSWQTTAYFQKEEEYAREVVARAEQKGGV